MQETTGGSSPRRTRTDKRTRVSVYVQEDFPSISIPLF